MINTTDNLKAFELGIPVGLIQRCALLGSARILRKVLEMQKGCFLASLGNLLLPGANEETSFNITNSCVNLK